ncbi:MAG: aminotransferase class I/II-fold pyridoxal phosphate-dependent enzyme [Flavobacteriales bacterium]|nr:aminotransferase class I/II-fold pyridoxal phosphate-dependent enzyme [Flavobacteriales bacterium]
MIKKAERLQSVTEYYFSKKLREVAQLRAEGKSIINMAIGNPDLPPPSEVLEAIDSAMNHDGAHQYQSYQGVPELRMAMSEFYKTHYQVQIDPNGEILPLMGSKEGIMHISMAFLNKGDGVLLPNPGYPTYASVSNLMEADLIHYDLDASNNWQPNYEELEKKDLSHVKIMWLNYPHMPTGTSATKNDLEKAIAFAKKHNLLIVNDNPYSFILNDEPQSILAIEGAKEVAIELNSLSKTFNMAGWRVGMVVGDAAIIKTILQVKSNMDSGMFLGIQKGAIAALKSPQSWFDELNAIYLKRREIVWQIFDALNCSYEKENAGMFVWAKLPEGKKSMEFIDQILNEKEVFITPGNIFGSQGEGYIRASLCISEKLLEEVLNRLSTAKN